MTIVDFLRARLDEDERAAVAARDSVPWTVKGKDTPVGEHLGRHLPDRVLREVAAKRAILDQYQEVMADQFPGRDRGAMVRVVDQMLSVYSDHEDYDPGWAP